MLLKSSNLIYLLRVKQDVVCELTMQEFPKRLTIISLCPNARASVFHRRSALMSVVSVLAYVLPIRTQFLDALAALESIVLQGSVQINLSLTAGIQADVIGGSDYGDIVWSVLVNSFESTTTFGTASFSIDLPITIPSGPEVFSFATIDATFWRNMTIQTITPIGLNQLFPDDINDARPIDREPVNSEVISIGPQYATVDDSFTAPYCKFVGSLCDTGYLIAEPEPKEHSNT